MTFQDMLEGAVKKNNSLLCVGLDPDMSKIPGHIKNSTSALFEFNKAIIDATADLVCVFKPNAAFYESFGTDGIEQLKETIAYINEKYPDIPVILDAKRADIGNTNNGYVNFVYEFLGANAVTLHPYLGREALEPFLRLSDKGAIVLCRTSNPGAGEFQNLIVEGMPMYEYVAARVTTEWNSNKNCLLVVGATYPEEMKSIRSIVGPEMVFLVPGIGAQGGDVEASMKAGLGANGRGLILSSSREILYASSDEDFAQAARAKALETRDEINKYR
jgi:orotidine-5'-phosphate decarboxylase